MSCITVTRYVPVNGAAGLGDILTDEELESDMESEASAACGEVRFRRQNVTFFDSKHPDIGDLRQRAGASSGQWVAQVTREFDRVE